VHVELLFLEGEFDRTFRMQPASLEKLLQKLAPSLLKSTPHNGTFGVEFVKPETVMMALRWLAGGNYGDIRLVAGCSVMTFFRHLWQVMYAIIAELCGCLLFVLEGLTIGMRRRNRLYLL